MTRRRAGAAAALAAAMLPPAALAVASAALGDDERQLLLARVLYWAMPVAVLAWVAAALHAARAAPASSLAWLARNAVPLAAAALATAAVLWSVPATMRMQFDETSLLATSQNMHLHRTAMMGTQALPAADGLAVVEWNLDKRPPLFPFFASVVHDATGYRVANAYAVNGALLFALLALVACRARRRLPVAAAIAAPVLLVAVPLLVATATCAGFELLALVLLASTVLAATDFAAAPSAPRAAWLLANGVLYAQVRYESVLVLAVLAAAVGFRVRRWPRDRVGTTLLLAAPSLLAPIVMLLLHSRAAHFYPEANGEPLVAVVHLAEHTPPLARAWLDGSATSAFAGWLGLASLGTFAAWVARRRGGFADVLAVAPVAAATAIALAWFHGDVREATALRLFLPVAVLAALGPLLLPALVRRAWVPIVLLAAAIPLAVRSVRAVRGGQVPAPQHAAVALAAVDAALAGLRPDPTRTVLVSTVAQYLIVRGYAALTPTAFVARATDLAGVERILLQTPLDDRLAAVAGDPGPVLRAARSTLLGRIEGSFPVAAWRLERGR